MKPTELVHSLKTAILALRPAFVWGAPGIGKSSVVRQVADALSRHLIDLRAVLLDPVDMRGLPHLDAGICRWAPPAFLPQGDTPTLLFLDELPQAPLSVQNACSQLVLDRRLGEYILPPGVAIVAAGNRETDRAATNRMPSHLRSRFVHFDLDVDLADWCKWALAAGVMPEIVAFLRFRPNLLHDFDPTRTDRSYPCPRTWEIVSDLLKADHPNTIEYHLIAGAVGDGAATEFTAFLRIYRQLPNPDAILLAPDTAPVPSDPSTLYALCGALATRASTTNASRLLAYAKRLPPEFSVLLVRDSIERCSSLQTTAAFVDWSTKYGDILI